jgi:hypothetical protein
MSEAVVVALTFVASYGAILGYALYLHRRRQQAGD